MQRTTYTFEMASVVAAAPARVWARVSTLDGVNAELMPLARMTAPQRGGELDLTRAPISEALGRSWILLFGFLPADYDDLRFLRIEPGHSFLESSTLLSQRVWVHERTLTAVDGGCRVTDRVEFEPRLPFLGGLYLRAFRFFFAHRHRRLRRMFGSLDGGARSPRA